ncbi:hypothetical protein PAXINDRAFT_171259 [Paxillus involutus ATCC 200175]|uniref:Unplaced genomic scaffold PAXINscaffold_43, whole genome shotgun sequence n=1 Tax=Paxillus involutus ATCC 200175 TaxID=664439 RepID=A0A0C9TP46_PAXIN|nr:hypothetical protein PAXINDRAFT_171259 [Paxillus involutus ATCC 200175]
MSVFNPRILDACIQNVTVDLNDSQRVDVLLHALQHFPAHGCRTTMENAVQSLLQVPSLPSTDIAKALLLRAKVRLAAGYRTSAQQDLHAVLTVDPENQDVKELIQSQHLRPEMLLRVPDCPPGFSVEVWREIALFLPKRDLKSLLLVPNALSRIASQLLFREIDLHLTAAVEPGKVEHRPRIAHGECIDQGVDAWHYQRSADILTRILVDAHFATQVKSLSVYAASYDTMQPLAFQVGMLMNALPKLSNLRKVHCSGSKDLITRMLRNVHSHNPRLQNLSIVVADLSNDIEIPVFKHLTHFSMTSEGGCSGSTHAYLAQCRDSLRSLSINNPRWRFPAEAMSVRHLTQLEFNGCFSTDSQAFSEILTNGHQLESLMLSGALECTPSSLFLQHRSSLPFLRHFSLTITSLHRHITDRELCPAISEFLRERTHLVTYHLLVPSTDHRRIGFDASAWGVLPALPNLRSLSITYPRDLSPALAGWLIPRSVRALLLDLSPTNSEDFVSFMSQLRAGMPPMLRYMGITSMPIRSVLNVVEHGFLNVRVVRVDSGVWTVTRAEDGSLEVEQWPYRRAKYHAAEWLESLDCADAIWKGVDCP